LWLLEIFDSNLELRKKECNAAQFLLEIFQLGGPGLGLPWLRN
jgi:hypothetical protein